MEASQLVPSLWWPSLLLGLLAVVYFQLRDKHRYWQRLGIKGPRPLPFIGNLHTQFIYDTPELGKQWVLQYGKVHGFYQGLSPVLVIADPGVATQICIKDFEYFTDHGLFTDKANEYQQNFLFFLKGDHWKKVRTLMSPTFTSGKMRRMFKLMDICADNLLNICDKSIQENNGLIKLKDAYSLYTFDAISTSCYSLKIDWKGSTNLDQASKISDVVKAGLELFAFRPLRFFVGILMPLSIAKATNFEMFPVSALEPILQKVSRIIEERRKSGRRVEDYLQMLIEARLSQDIELDDLDDKEAHHVGQNQKSMAESQAEMVKQMAQTASTSSETKLSDIEVLSHACLLMLVGLETTANMLTTTSYVLAFHQDIQQTLYEEVAKLATYDENDTEKRNARFSYDDLTCCQYLDSVISECLRFINPVHFTSRLANKDYYLEKYNLIVPKGNELIVQMHALHHDPDYWDQPEKIDPTRFMPDQRAKIVPGSYLPFGIGPRHCIGMRFSLTETKLALARILVKYRMEPAPNTKFPPELKTSLGLVKVKNGLAKFVER